VIGSTRVPHAVEKPASRSRGRCATSLNSSGSMS